MPPAIRASVITLRTHGVVLGVAALVGIVAVLFESNEILQGIILLGILAYGLPAIFCLLLPRALQARKSWGFLVAWLLHAALAFILTSLSSGIALSNERDFGWIVFAIIAAPLGLVHGSIAVGLLLPSSRDWLRARRNPDSDHK